MYIPIRILAFVNSFMLLFSLAKWVSFLSFLRFASTITWRFAVAFLLIPNSTVNSAVQKCLKSSPLSTTTCALSSDLTTLSQKKASRHTSSQVWKLPLYACKCLWCPLTRGSHHSFGMKMSGFFAYGFPGSFELVLVP